MSLYNDVYCAIGERIMKNSEGKNISTCSLFRELEYDSCSIYVNSLQKGTSGRILVSASFQIFHLIFKWEKNSTTVEVSHMAPKGSGKFEAPLPAFNANGYPLWVDFYKSLKGIDPHFSYHVCDEIGAASLEALYAAIDVSLKYIF